MHSQQNIKKCMTMLLSAEGFCAMESVTSHECDHNRVNVFERGILLPSSNHAMPTVFCTVLTDCS